MHNTTLMRLFTKPYIRWEKSAQLPIKPQQPKQPREKKQKNIEKTKKKNLGFQGKVLGVTSPKSLGFFVFFGFLEFFCFFVFFGLLELFFVFLFFF